MPSPPEVERGFADALLGEADASLLAAILGDGLAPAARLAVYRNHVLLTLTEALAATYPVVRRLVDPRFFAYAADRFIRDHPPAGPCLFEYGEPFAEFLATFEPCRHLPYLPDVARLEWAITQAAHAADATPVDPAHLVALVGAATAGAILVLDPSAAYLDSPWPVDRIWRVNQPDADPAAPVDLDAGGARLEVRRHGEDVVFRRLDAAVYALRAALAAGHDLGRAVAAAQAAEPALDLTLTLRSLLDDKLVVDLIVPPRTMEARHAH
jgi:hypothetical protein